MHFIIKSFPKNLYRENFFLCNFNNKSFPNRYTYMHKKLLPMYFRLNHFQYIFILKSFPLYSIVN